MKKTKCAKTNDKSKKYILLRLWKYLYRYKLILLLSLILVIVSNVLALWGPNLSGKAIDAIGTTAGGVDFDAVLHYATLMIIFYVTSEVLSYVLSVNMKRTLDFTICAHRNCQNRWEVKKILNGLSLY